MDGLEPSFDGGGRHPPGTPMAEAKAWLKDRGIKYESPSRFHIRIWPNINFYPKTGAIFIDGGEKKLDVKGYDALEKLLGERWRKV